MRNTQPENALLTFRIGPEKQIFRFDKQIVSNASPVLNRMIKRDLKELSEGTVDLPEPSVFTFLRFVLYAHELWSGNSTTSKERGRVSHLAHGPLIAKFIDKGLENFYCRQCCKIGSLKYTYSFPYCKDCGRCDGLIKPFSRACTLCKSAELGCLLNDIFICEECCIECGLGYRPYSRFTLNEHASNNLEGHVEDPSSISVFRFDVPLLAVDMMASLPRNTMYSKSDMCMKEIVCDWKFADMYEATGFGHAAVFALFHQLVMKEHTNEDIVALITSVYDQTPDSGREVSFSNKNILRRLVSSYIAYHSEEIQLFPAFGDLMCSGRELALDVLMVTSKLREGGLGRGW